MAFGTIYLGETFCSYISLGNYSVHDTVHVTVKVFFSPSREASIPTGLPAVVLHLPSLPVSGT